MRKKCGFNIDNVTETTGKMIANYRKYPHIFTNIHFDLRCNTKYTCLKHVKYLPYKATATITMKKQAHYQHGQKK